MAHANQNDVDTRAVFLVGALGVVLLILVVILLQMMFYRVESDLYAKTYADPQLDVARVNAEQLELLGSYSYVDREKGIIRIPVQRAMELLAREPARGGARPQAAQPEK